jgi:demethylmenaquinone methyltransferase / 2-methoxy-6-polyprenyl-1,4-benzoquinol methylase
MKIDPISGQPRNGPGGEYTAIRAPEANKARSESIQAMFQRIAPHYDLMNRLMTGGQDVAWRRQVIRLANLQPCARLLDLGTGTGDLTREALRQSPGCRPVSADFTLEMMQAGQRMNGPVMQWSCADALSLPFPDETFDAVVSGFLLRNVVDLPRALREQMRVLKPGGRMVALDTTRPRKSMLSPFIQFHMHRVIPFLGGLLTGSRDAYTYLPETSEHFLMAEDLQGQIKTAGFGQAGFKRLNFGTVAIHWGVKR